MKKRIISFAIGALALMSVPVLADLTVLDGTGATKTIYGYVCFTTKLCNATAIVNSAGTEIATASNPLRTDPTGTTPQPVTGTFWQATQPVSGTVAATQSGTWNVNAITTLPAITGTVTANAGTNLNTSLLALESGGNLASLVAQIGAVTASPTANTVLDRLKTINTTLGSPLQAGGTVTANIGTAGTLATASNQTGGGQKTQIVDGSGNVIGATANALDVNIKSGGGSGGTSSSYGAAFPATGTAVGMSQGGNMVAMTGTSGNLNVQCANCSGSGVSTADQAAFTAGSSLFAGTGGFYQTTATSNPLTNGQQGMWQMTANRAGFVNFRNASGTEIGTSSSEVFVGGRGTAGSAAGGVLSVQGVASMTPLFVSSATAPVSTMNNASANGGINAANAAVFDDVSPTSITENNFGYLRMSANRNLYGTIRDAAGNERGVNVDASNRLTTAPSLVSGSVASGAVASGAFASGSIASGAIAAGAQVDLLTMRGTKNAGTAATNSLLAGGVYNATPLTLSDTQQASFQFDANGYLKISTPVGIAQGASLGSLTGSMIMGSVTTSAPTYTTGTVQPASFDTAGNQRVVCSNCSGSGATGTDQGTFTAGTSVFAPGGGFFQTTATSNALTNGQWGAWQMTAQRAGFVNLRNASGTEIGTATTALIVGGKGTAGSADTAVQTVQGIASMTPLLTNPGTATSWGIRAEDTAAADGDLGVGALAIRKATPANTSNADGDYEYLQMSAGRLWTNTLLGDGTNAVAVKAASTAPVAGDPALVVATSPNSPARAVAGEGATGSTAPTGAQLQGVQSGANMVAMLQASASAAINVSTATTTQLVALSGSTKIYVTSFDVIAGGTGNITFVYGTGSNCGTGTTSLTGAYNLVAQAGIAKGSGIGPVLVVPSGNALCVTTSAAVQMSGSVSYTQF